MEIYFFALQVLGVHRADGVHRARTAVALTEVILKDDGFLEIRRHEARTTSVDGQGISSAAPAPRPTAADSIDGRGGNDKVAGLPPASDELKGAQRQRCSSPAADGNDWLYGGTGATASSPGNRRPRSPSSSVTKLGQGKAG